MRRPGLDLVASSGQTRVFVLCLVGVCVLSAPVFCTRFLNDMDYYSLVADKLLRGAVLYRDAMDTKPPMVFLHYAAIFKLFGRADLAAVKLVTMVFLVGSCWLMRGLYQELFPGSGRPERAALLFVLASFSGWGEDFLSSNTEILANLFVLAGVLLMAKEHFGRRTSFLVPAGALLGIAVLYRYQSGAALIAYAFTIAGAPMPWTGRARRLLTVAIGALLPLLAVIAYYSRIGGLRDLAFLLRYQWIYVGQHELYWPHLLAQVAIVAAGQGPIVVLAASQARRMLGHASGTRERFVLWFTLFSVLPFFAGGHYFAHYIVQAVPGFVLLATRRLSPPEREPARDGDGWFFRHARAIILINVALFWMINTGYYLAWPADPPDDEVSRFVRLHTDPADPVFLWSQRREILLDADRVYATRFLSNEFLTGRLYGSRYRRESATAESARAASVPDLWPALLEDLEAEKPRLIVDDGPARPSFTIEHYPALSAFARAHYEPGKVIDGFCVYVRKSD